MEVRSEKLDVEVGNGRWEVRGERPSLGRGIDTGVGKVLWGI